MAAFGSSTGGTIWRLAYYLYTSMAAISEFPQRRPIASLVVAVLACEIVGASGGLFTATGLETWYPELTKPAITPPSWVFGPVWTGLFALMGSAVWFIWREIGGGEVRGARLALGMFVAQFVLNVAWSAVFFGFRSILWGLVVILVLWVAVIATVVLFDRVNRVAAALLVPYLAWVSFAGYLNYLIWTLN